MASADRLNRILGMIPFLLQNQEVPLEELAEEFQVKPSELVRDLQALSHCSYGPFGSAEVMDAYIEDGKVHLWAGEHFKRPLSFTPSELLALRTAISMMIEHTDVREARALAHAYKLITDRDEDLHTRASALKGQIGVEPPPALSGEIFSILERGVHESRKVEIRYFTEHRGTVSERIVWPCKMVFSDGRWYIVGYCEKAGGYRTFRADNVRSAQLLGEHFSIPADFRLEDHFQQGVYVETEDEEEIVVRYSPPAAQLVMEEEGRGKPARDGTVTLSYRTSSPRWLLQRLLSYGESAELVSPSVLRHGLVDRLRDMAEIYREEK